MLLACCRRSAVSPLASALSLHSRSSAVSCWFVTASSFASRSRSLTDCTRPPKEATWSGLGLGLGLGLGSGLGLGLGSGLGLGVGLGSGLESKEATVVASCSASSIALVSYLLSLTPHSSESSSRCCFSLVSRAWLGLGGRGRVWVWVRVRVFG